MTALPVLTHWYLLQLSCKGYYQQPGWCWLLGSAAWLTSGPWRLPTSSTWKVGTGRRLLGAQDLFQYGVGNSEAYACEKWCYVLYVNVVIIPDDRLHIPSCRVVTKSSEGCLKKINVIKELSILISTCSADTILRICQSLIFSHCNPPLHFARCLEMAKLSRER